MSGFAINGSSMRAVDSAEDLTEGESFYEELPDPWPPTPTIAQSRAMIRAKRNGYLNQLDRVILRHRRQKDLGVATTLTDEQYLTVLQIAQDLAGIPEQPGFPTTVTWPTQPAWLTDPDGDE